MTNLTLKQLRAAAEILRHGTITRAANQMHLTPAALTARLKQTEEELGLRLFDRTRSGLRATEGGRTLLAAAEEVDAVLKRCVERIEVLKGVRGGRVTVGVVSTGKYFAPGAVAAFRREFPGVEVRLTIGNRSEIVQALREYKADFAIMGRGTGELATRSEVLGDHPMVIAAAPQHRLARRRRIALSELAAEAFLVREPGSGSRAVFDRLAARISPEPLGIAMEIDSNESIKQGVIAGLGIALLSAHTIEAELGYGRLVVLNVEGLPFLRQWLLVRRADYELGPAAQSFWNFMLRNAQQLLPQLRLKAIPSA